MDLMTYALCKGNGGGGLPTPTEADQGRFLCVSPQSEWVSMGMYDSERALEYDFEVNINGELVLGEYPLTISEDTIKKIGSGELVFVARIPYIGGDGYFVAKVNGYSGLNYVSLELTYLDFDGNYQKAIIILNSNAYSYPQIQNLCDFVITGTPTSPNYSGTMDRSPQEITDAINAGRRIIFSIPSMSAKVVCDQFQVVNSQTVAAAKILYSNMIIFVVTQESDSGGIYVYGTDVYTLTPLS